MTNATITSWLQHSAGLNPSLQGQLLRSVLLVALLWFLYWLIVRFGLTRIDELSIRYRTQKILNYVVFTLGFLLVGRIWFVGVASLATFLGLLSAGLAISLKDPIVSFVAWLFILWRRPFEVGDRIQIGQHAGDVIDQRIFQFTLMEIGNWVDADQTTGRVIHIPNANVFTQPQANYSKGTRFIWNELPVLVTYESDWKAAKQILHEIVSKRTHQLGASARQDLRIASRQFMVHNVDFEPRVYTSVQDSGVLLTLRYLCEPQRRRSSAEAIWEDVLDAFAEHDNIDFAYPTVRYYDNTYEGKEGARATRPNQMPVGSIHEGP